MTPDLQLPEADARLAKNRLSATADFIDGRIATLDGDGEDGLLEGSMRRSSERLAEAPIGLGGSRLVDGVLHGAFNRRTPAAVRHLPLEPQQLDQVSALFKLLSDKTRLAILQILCEGEMNVTTLCRRLQLPQPTVSHHLGLLRMHQLIGNRRSGKQVFYRLHDRVEPAASRSDNGLGQGSAPEGLQIVDNGFAVQIARAP